MASKGISLHNAKLAHRFVWTTNWEMIFAKVSILEAAGKYRPRGISDMCQQVGGSMIRAVYPRLPSFTNIMQAAHSRIIVHGSWRRNLASLPVARGRIGNRWQASCRYAHILECPTKTFLFHLSGLGFLHLKPSKSNRGFRWDRSSV